jgi:hypothetical protein
LLSITFRKCFHLLHSLTLFFTFLLLLFGRSFSVFLLFSSPSFLLRMTAMQIDACRARTWGNGCLQMNNKRGKISPWHIDAKIHIRKLPLILQYLWLLLLFVFWKLCLNVGLYFCHCILTNNGNRSTNKKKAKCDLRFDTVESA